MIEEGDWVYVSAGGSDSQEMQAIKSEMRSLVDDQELTRYERAWLCCWADSEDFTDHEDWFWEKFLTKME